MICCSLEVLTVDMPLDISDKEHEELLSQNEIMEQLQSLHVSCSHYRLEDLAELGNQVSDCLSVFWLSKAADAAIKFCTNLLSARVFGS